MPYNPDHNSQGAGPCAKATTTPGFPARAPLGSGKLWLTDCPAKMAKGRVGVREGWEQTLLTTPPLCGAAFPAGLRCLSPTPQPQLGRRGAQMQVWGEPGKPSAKARQRCQCFNTPRLAGVASARPRVVGNPNGQQAREVPGKRRRKGGKCSLFCTVAGRRASKIGRSWGPCRPGSVQGMPPSTGTGRARALRAPHPIPHLLRRAVCSPKKGS